MVMKSTVLEATDLSIGYRPWRKAVSVVADSLSIALQAGQLTCLLGPNGAGKSTLMRTLAGMQPPLNGRLLLDGVDMANLSPQLLAKKLSVVLTESVDVGLLSAYALVALGRYPYTDWHGRLTAVDEAAVQQAMEAVGATALAARPVNQLSDGERQKVMIARALAQEPHLMMLDEPTAFLDLPRRVEMMQILQQLAHQQGRAILLSTHDLDLALRHADVLWLLADGRLHVGAPEDLVLNGVFADVFAATGVQFDPLTGAFYNRQPPHQTIAVVGEGVQAIWTVRALERAGYQVVMGSDGRAPEVHCQPGSWQLRHAYGRAVYHSLADLLQGLKQ